MEQEVMQRRNHLFDVIYRKTLSLYRFFVPTPLRWALEIFILVMACGVLCLWGYVHFVYIQNSRDCLEHISPRPFPYDVILQVEVYENTTSLWKQREIAVAELYESLSSQERRFSEGSDSLDEVGGLSKEGRDKVRRPKRRHSWSDQLLKSFQELYLDPFDVDVAGDSERVDVSEEGSKSEDTQGGDGEERASIGDQAEEEPASVKDPMVQGAEEKGRQTGSDLFFMESPSSFAARQHTLYELFDFYSLRLLTFEYTILEFSQESGYLSLSQAARSRLNISVVKVYIDPHNATCFGGPFGQFFTQYFLGYEMMVISSFKNLLPSGHSLGYVKNLLTGGQYYYRVQWMGKWRYGAGMLPALFFTLVASVLLRQIHYHAFKLLAHFNNLLNQGIPIPVQTGAQLPFLVITYAAIGLIIVMSEALSDDSVFSLLMVATVWEVDQFYALYCRKAVSKRLFPWFFYLYHFLPYAYFIRFNGQFWFIPFLFHWLLLQHAMLFFLHHYELPMFRQNVQPVHVIRLRHIIPGQHPPGAPAQPVLLPGHILAQPPPQPEAQEWDGVEWDGVEEEVAEEAHEPLQGQEGAAGMELRQRHVGGDVQDNLVGLNVVMNHLHPHRRPDRGVGAMDRLDHQVEGSFSDDEGGVPGEQESANEVVPSSCTEEESSSTQSTVVVGASNFPSSTLGRDRLRISDGEPSGLATGSHEGLAGDHPEGDYRVLGPDPRLLRGGESADNVGTHLSPEQLRVQRVQHFDKRENSS